MDAALKWLAANSAEWPSRPWIVNVGGNIGDTCIQLCKRETKRVLVCEPVPDTFRLLAQNVEMNQLGARVTYRQVAIGDQDGNVEMAVTRDSGWSEVRASDGREGFTLLEQAKQYISVPSRTLEALVADESLVPQDVALVWSDTQGFEAQVIRGGATLWASGVPLWAEFWPAGLAAHGGIENFITVAQEHFRGFLDEASLTGAPAGSPVALRPISELKGFAERIATMQATDLLLVP
jgi:FkbM family methyltransferase